MNRRLLIPFILIFILSACLRPASNPSGQVPGIGGAQATTVTTPASTATGEAEINSTLPAISRTPPSAGYTQTAAHATVTLTATSGSPSPIEYPVINIPLAGAASDRNAEISGMAWYSNTLILLPQYPSRFGSGDGAVLALDRAEILAYINDLTDIPLMPRTIPLIAPGVNKLTGFEGFEAIGFSGERAFLTIETKPGAMLAYLVSGTIKPDLSELRLDTSRMAQIPPQTGITNLSDEALVVAGQRLVTLYEANGAAVNPKPAAHLFDFNLNSQGTVSFAAIEYRITDATPADDYGRFWAINYFYPGDTQLLPAADPLAVQFGEGATHSQFNTVERLVEFVFTEYGITFSDAPPIQIQLIDDDHSRNWEAIARLEGYGFLLATDKFPETILGFLAYP